MSQHQIAGKVVDESGRTIFRDVAAVITLSENHAVRWHGMLIVMSDEKPFEFTGSIIARDGRQGAIQSAKIIGKSVFEVTGADAPPFDY